MTVCLLIENGHKKGQSFDLTNVSGALVIGTDPEQAQLVLEEDFVAPKHAIIGRLKDGRFGVRSLIEDEPVRVNDEAVQSARLAHGDRLQVGGAFISFLEKARESSPGNAAEAEPPGVEKAPAEPPAGQADSMVGREIGGFRLLEHLGRGGMGTVYRALQISLDREVALKVLSPSLCANQSFVEQFIREARAAGKLNHPNIVQVYDVSQEGNCYFYAMEYIAGGSLEERLDREGKLPWKEALRFVRDAAHGLEYAESMKIVHRDIKPDNLMVDARGIAKIADLGLAGSHDDSFEKSKGILGTPHFISPEQVQGKPVDSRADLYSLGATCYRLVAGRTPFRGKSVKEIIRAQVQDEPEPLREIEPEIPETVEAVVTRMMAKDPADRYQSASDLVSELDAVLSGRATTGGARGRWLGLGALVVVLLAVGAFVAFGGSRGESSDGNGGETAKAAGQGGDSAGHGNPRGSGDPPSNGNPQNSGGQSAGTGEAGSPQVTPPDGPNDAERIRRELREANSRIAFEDARRVEGTREERIAAFAKVQKEFEDTAWGQKAREEAERLATEIRTLAAGAEAMRAAVEEQLAKGSYDPAFAAVSTAIAALPEGLRGEAQILEVAKAERTRIGERAKADFLERSRDGEKAIGELAFGSATKLVDESKKRFALEEATLATIPDELRKEFSGYQEKIARLHTLIEQGRALQNKKEHTQRRIQTYRCLFDGDGVATRIKGHRYRAALEAIDALAPSLDDDVFGGYLGRRRAELERAFRAHERLRSLFDAEGARPLTIKNPESNRRCYLVRIEEDNLVLSRRRDGSNPTKVDISAVDTMDEVIDLYVPQLDESPTAALDVAYLLVLQGSIQDALRARGMIANYLSSKTASSLSGEMEGKQGFETAENLLAAARDRGAPKEELAALQAFMNREKRAAESLAISFRAIGKGRFKIATEAIAVLSGDLRESWFYGLLSECRMDPAPRDQ